MSASLTRSFSRLTPRICTIFCLEAGKFSTTACRHKCRTRAENPECCSSLLLRVEAFSLIPCQHHQRLWPPPCFICWPDVKVDNKTSLRCHFKSKTETVADMRLQRTCQLYSMYPWKARRSISSARVTLGAAQGRAAWHCWGSVAMAAPMFVYYGLSQRDICMVVVGSVVQAEGTVTNGSSVFSVSTVCVHTSHQWRVLVHHVVLSDSCLCCSSLCVFAQMRYSMTK